MWPFKQHFKHRLVSTRSYRTYDAGDVPYLRITLGVNFQQERHHTPEFIRAKAHHMVDDMMDKAATEELAHPLCGKGAH